MICPDLKKMFLIQITSIIRLLKARKSSPEFLYLICRFLKRFNSCTHFIFLAALSTNMKEQQEKNQLFCIYED